MSEVIEKRPLHLRLREVAEQRGHTMSSLARDARLNLNQVRRYWYNTTNGLAKGPPLREVSLPSLETLANLLEVSPADLLSQECIVQERIETDTISLPVKQRLEQIAS